MSFFFHLFKNRYEMLKRYNFRNFEKYNYRIIIIKMLYIKYFNNVYLFAIRFAIIFIIIFITIFSCVLYFD